MDEGYLYLASCNYHFIRVHENLAQHPSNYISINIRFSKIYIYLFNFIVYYLNFNNKLMTVQNKLDNENN